MRKWVVFIFISTILLGALILFFNPFGGGDVKYTNPDQVQNRPEVKEQLLRKFSNSKKLQMASLEYARQFQVAISFPELARETYTKLDKAGECFAALYGDKYYIPSRDIEAIVVNTYKRANAYLKFNVNLSGYMYVVPIAHSIKDCHFDPNSLEN